jgi:hypothetical protein
VTGRQWGARDQRLAAGDQPDWRRSTLLTGAGTSRNARDPAARPGLYAAFIMKKRLQDISGNAILPGASSVLRLRRRGVIRRVGRSA